MNNQRILVVGGSSGMGLAVATLAARRGAAVILAARSAEKLRAVADRLGANATWHTVDTSSEDDVRRLFDQAGELDHLVVSGSSTKTGPLRELPLADAELTLRSKFLGPYLCAKHAHIRPSGSITFFSGILAQRPGTGMPILAAANAAVEALGRALALELAPVRVNTVSPGMTRDTGAYLGMPEAAREGMFRDIAARLPVKKVGTPDDLAAATLALMENPFLTGVTLPVDGGGLLV